MAAGLRMYAMFDFHGHSSRRNVFIYGPKVTPTNQKSLRAKSLAYLIATMTDMFRFNSCLWKVDPPNQLSKSKKRTLRGVFLSLAKTKYAFTFEHSVSNFDTRSNRNQAWTDRTLRDMGGYICSAFGKFVVSSLQSPKIFFSDYYPPSLDKANNTEEKRKAAYADFSARLSAVIEDREPMVDIENLVDSMKQFEAQVEPDEYSEGGSDSEFSDEDLKGVERRALLNNISSYTENYAKGQPVSNFVKSMKHDLLKINVRKKKNDLEEFIKLKEFRQRFEDLEKKNPADKVQPMLVPQINFIKPVAPIEKVKDLVKEPSKVEPVNKPKPMSSNRSPFRIETLHLKRDSTMPHLRKTLASTPNQPLLIQSKNSEKKKPTPLMIIDNLDDDSRVLNLKSVSTSHGVPPFSTERDVPDERIRLDYRQDRHKTVYKSTFLPPSLTRNTLERKTVGESPLSEPMDPHQSIFHDNMSRDILDMRSNFLYQMELHNRFIVKSVKKPKHRDPVYISVQTLELNVCNSSKPGVYRPKGMGFPLAKFYTKSPNYY